MPKDTTVTCPRGVWTRLTDTTLGGVEMLQIRGAEKVVLRWQDAEPVDTDASVGYLALPGAGEKDHVFPNNGAVTHLWALAPWGNGAVYIRHG